MSESGDYDPGPWRGHDFGSARAHYDTHAGRSYHEATTAGKTLKDLIPRSITTNCCWPLIIATDQTGSMHKWPGTMFSKMPYLDKEGQEYLGEDMEISFMAFGDANSGYRDDEEREDYPLQVRPFTKGLDLKTRIEELVQEGKGGGQLSETSEIIALYCLHRVHTPKATHKPILVIVTDEKCYDTIDPDNAKRLVGITIEKPLKTSEVFRKLQEKFSVYLIRKPYEKTGDKMSPVDRQIFNHWADLVGEDHISDLPAAERVVDVIFGILAKETERITYFEEELTGRQTAEQVDTVFKSLRTIHKVADPDRSVHSGKSVIHGVKTATGDTMKPLL